MPRADSALDLTDDVVTLTAALCDIESVSKGEAAIADAIEAALAELNHLTVTRIGNTLVARTDLGRAERVAFLFERYQQLTSLLPEPSAKPARARKPPRAPAPA